MFANMKFGIIGSGSWATAIAKILTDNRHTIQWWIRSPQTTEHIVYRRHNPHYLPSAYFNTSQLQISSDIESVVAKSDVIIIAIPSAYVTEALEQLPANAFEGKKVVSAVKGILPQSNLLLNEFLERQYAFSIQNYFTLLGPCHAEEVAAEKLSYLTFSGYDNDMAASIAQEFKNEYINVITNIDVWGVQYAAVLKNVYALGAGVAHGLEYGDNFLSVYIANAATEMVSFLKPALQLHPENNEPMNYAASVYLGDLLVTCYSLYSRNRMFGNMIGKGYSVKAAQLELNMIAEGYNASKCIFNTNKNFRVNMPIAENIYNILWNNVRPQDGFSEIEKILV